MSWTVCSMEPALPPRFGTRVPLPPRGTERAEQQGRAAAHTKAPAPAGLSTEPVPGPTAGDGPNHSSQGAVGWGQRGAALAPGLRRGLRSDKGYGYLSIVNGYSIKLTGGQRFPLDFESPQGRETKLQSPTFTLLKRKTKHKRERCDLAACDGWSEAGQGRGYGEFRVALGDAHAVWPFLLQSTCYSHAITVCSRQAPTWQQAPLSWRRVPYNCRCETGKVQSIPKPIKEVKAT